MTSWIRSFFNTCWVREDQIAAVYVREDENTRRFYLEAQLLNSTTLILDETTDSDMAEQFLSRIVQQLNRNP